MNIPSLAVAHVIQAEGDAWRVSGDITEPLRAGTVLQEGQLLHTGDHGVVLVQLASGHEIGLGPEQTLLLDADVLASRDADTSEWMLDGRANPGMIAEWLAPAAAPLELAAVLDVPGENLDELLKGTAPVTVDSDQMHQLLLAGIGDDGLACLLRSLYGPDSG